MKKWGLGYSIIYQENKKELENKWIDSGFSELSSIHWDFLEDDLKDYSKLSYSKLLIFASTRPCSDVTIWNTGVPGCTCSPLLMLRLLM